MLLGYAALFFASAHPQRSLSEVSLHVVELMEKGVTKYLEHPVEPAHVLLQQILTNFSSLKKVLRKAQQNEAAAANNREKAPVNVEERHLLEADNRHLEETVKMMVEETRRCQNSLEDATLGHFQTKQARDALNKVAVSQLESLETKNAKLRNERDSQAQTVQDLKGALEQCKREYIEDKHESQEVESLKQGNANLMKTVNHFMHDNSREKLESARKRLEEKRGKLEKEYSDRDAEREKADSDLRDQAEETSDKLTKCNASHATCRAQLQSLETTHWLCVNE